MVKTTLTDYGLQGDTEEWCLRFDSEGNPTHRIKYAQIKYATWQEAILDTCGGAPSPTATADKEQRTRGSGLGGSCSCCHTSSLAWDSLVSCLGLSRPVPKTDNAAAHFAAALGRGPCAAPVNLI